jgi:UDP-N-acetylmuramyl tripeptide synthase
MLRFYTAILFSKMAYYLIKLTKKSGGTSFAGMLALKICPDFLKYCRKYAFQIATITGTNGKTTTSGILANILEYDQNRVIHNVKGANMLTGIANVFALNLPCKRFDYAVLESDEAYLTKLYDYLNVDFLIVTNLFRDQLDRYGELSTTAGFIQNAIDKINPILFLNADDPLVSNLGKNKEVFYYGFENVEFCSEKQSTLSTAPSEVFNCICGEKLEYSKQFFAQQGHYYCPKCGYRRPELTFKGNAKIFDNYSEITINFEDKSLKVAFIEK